MGEEVNFDVYNLIFFSHTLCWTTLTALADFVYNLATAKAKATKITIAISYAMVFITYWVDLGLSIGIDTETNNSLIGDTNQGAFQGKLGRYILGGLSVLAKGIG